MYVANNDNTVWYIVEDATPVTFKAELVYNANGGTGTVPATQTETVNKGSNAEFTVADGSALTNDGYEFIGWNTRADGKGTAYAAGSKYTFQNVTANVSATLYAQWRKNQQPTTATVIYHVNGGTATTDPVTRNVDPSTYTVETIDSVNFTAPADKPYFLYWADSQTVTAGTTTYAPGSNISISAGETLDLWAQWSDSAPSLPSTMPDWGKLEFSKTVDKAFAVSGEDITYTITVKNGTDQDLTSVVVSDPLPQEVTYKSHTPAEVTKNENEYTIATLNKGETAVIKITATVNANVENGTYIKNVARITSAGGNEILQIISGEATTTAGTEPAWSGLSISKAVDKKFATLGETLTYTIKVKNETGAGLKDMIVLDTLPIDKVSVVSSSLPTSATYDAATGKVEVHINSLNAGAETSFNITVTVLPETTDDVVNTAAITAACSDSNVEASEDDLKGKTARASTTVIPEVSMVTITVKFVGLDASTMLPAAYTLTGAASNEIFSGAIPLTRDETADTAVYTDSFTAVLGKEYALNFTQSGYDVEGYTCDATASVTRTVTIDREKEAAVDITLNYTKTVEMPAEITVKFVGLDASTVLPAAYTLTGAASNEIFSGAITLTRDETADTAVYTGTVTAAPGKEYALNFTQSGYDVEGYICDATASVTRTVTADREKGVAVDITLNYTKVNWAGLTITKTADKTYATPGSYVKYTITVTNNSGVDLTNVNVLDYLPTEVRYATSFGGYDSGASSWTIARLADGRSATVTIRVRLNSGLSTGTKIENTAYVTEVTVDGQEYVFENQWLNDTAVVTVTGGKGAPKTGDESNLGLWIAVMAASLVCAGAVVVVYKKRRNGND